MKKRTCWLLQREHCSMCKGKDKGEIRTCFFFTQKGSSLLWTIEKSWFKTGNSICCRPWGLNCRIFVSLWQLKYHHMLPKHLFYTWYLESSNEQLYHPLKHLSTSSFLFSIPLVSSLVKITILKMAKSGAHHQMNSTLPILFSTLFFILNSFTH